MKKTICRIAVIVTILGIMIALSACGGLLGGGGGTTADVYSGFEVSGLRKGYAYTVNETVTVLVKGKAAKADSYNIYLKIGSGEETKVKSISDGGSYSYTFTEVGEYAFRIIAVLDNVEKNSSSGKLEFTITVADVTEIAVKDNVIDIYVNGGDKTYKWEELGISTPSYKIFTPSSDEISEYLTIEKATNDLTAVKTRGEPFVFTLIGGENNDICTRLYIRVHENTTKAALSDFIVDYPGVVSSKDGPVGKTYSTGDWVSFSCVEYAGQNAAGSYSVEKSNDGGETFSLLTTASGSYKTEEKYGHTVYSVKTTEAGSLYLKFTAIVNGTATAISKIVTVPVVALPVAPTSITLNETAKTLMKNQTYTIEATVLPEATTDKSLTYTLAEGGEEFVTVSESGLITALKKTTKPIDITVASKENPDIFATFKVSVTDINVTLSRTGGELTQTLGAASGNDKQEDIEFTVEGTPEGATFVWKKNGTTVKESSQDKTYTFPTTALTTAGSYSISVEITTVSGIIEESATVILNSGVLTMPSVEKSYYKDETENMLVVAKKLGARVELALCKVNEDYIETIANNAEYTFDTAGSYKIRVSLFKDSTTANAYEIRYSDSFDVIDSSSHEIDNLHVTGLKSGDNYYPFVKWKRLGRGVNYWVEVTKNSVITTMESTDTDYADYFKYDGFLVPSTVATLNDSFSVRVKTDISNRYCNSAAYAGEITIDLYGYLTPVIGNTVTYINNIMDFADIMNYYKVFRPLAHTNDGTEFYMALTYDEDMEAYYGVQDEGSINTFGAKTASKLMGACNDCYFEGGGISYQIKEGANGDNSVNIKITSTEPAALTKTLVNTPAEAGFAEWIDGNKPKLDNSPLYTQKDDTILMEQAYAPIPRGADNTVFPIDSETRELIVSTSDELYIAILEGYKPTPIENSVAETIYDNAKAILNRIIGNSMSNNQKIIAIFDYLSSEVVYDDYVLAYYEYLLGRYGIGEANSRLVGFRAFALEGSLIDGIAVCDGISKAFALLCGIEDIPVCRVTGTGNGGEHAWNIVLADDGQWYNVDATWGRVVFEKAESSADYAGVKHYNLFCGKTDFGDHIAAGRFPAVAEKRADFYYEQYDATRYIMVEDLTEYTSFINSIWSEMASQSEYMVDFYISYEEFEETQDVLDYMSANTPAASFSLSYSVSSDGAKYQYVTVFFYKK